MPTVKRPFSHTDTDEQRDALDRWMLEEILPTVDEMEAHPERLVPMDEAFDRIEAKLRALRLPDD